MNTPRNNPIHKGNLMMTEYTPLLDIPVTREQVENCIFSHWYPLFKKYIPKTRILKPVPDAFIQYLEQDSIKLPREEHVGSVYTDDIQRNEENDYSDWEKEEDDDDDGGSGEESDSSHDRVYPLKHFPEFHKRIKDTLEELSSVAPKLNWSAPRDATWILPNNTMRCREANEIYLLLSASNYIMHDLQHAFDEVVDREANTNRPEYELVLRQWFNVNPALEFRVFVEDGKIIGVSQRDLNYYDYLKHSEETFKDVINEFVTDVIVPKFPDRSFVVDVYIPRPFDKVFLIDINPFARKTDPLLFSWNELLTRSKNNDDFELRLVQKNNTGRFASKEHSENHVPKDIVDASLDPDSIRELAQKWKELLAMQEKEDDVASHPSSDGKTD